MRRLWPRSSACLKSPSPFFFLTSALLLLLLIAPNAARGAQAELIWDPPDIDPAGYKIYFGPASGSYTQSVDVGKQTSCTIDGLEEGNTYYFAATAYFHDEPESDFSNEISQYFPIADSDGDTLPDKDEISIYFTDPNNPDSDGDSIRDADEILVYGTNPKNRDTDGDGIDDGLEIFSEIIQAESGAITPPMEVVSDTDGNGRTYIETSRQKEGSAAYTFNIESDGVYALMAITYAPGNTADTLSITVDGQEPVTWDLNPDDAPELFGCWRRTSATRMIVSATGQNEHLPFTAPLHNGVHTLVITGGAPLARLDALYFEKIAELPDPSVDIEPPVIRLISPMHGDEISRMVPVKIDASDNIAVSKTELYVDGESHLTGDVGGFTLDTTELPDDDYELYVTALDVAGNTTQSETVLVHVKNTPAGQSPPEVTIVSPENDARLFKLLTRIQIQASDDAGVEKIELYIDGKLVKTKYGSKLSWKWQTSLSRKKGMHTIAAYAYDSDGNVAQDAITVYK